MERTVTHDFALPPVTPGAAPASWHLLLAGLPYSDTTRLQTLMRGHGHRVSVAHGLAQVQSRLVDDEVDVLLHGSEQQTTIDDITRLPCRPAEALAPAWRAPQATAAPASGLPVLLVEDNRINQRLASKLLEDRGYRVTLAENGQLALDALAHTSFAAVLMDMQMPVMDGLEATRRIRAREAASGLARTPIVAMTANAMQGDRERCLAAGMDDYLSKPINADELFRQLERWAQARPAA